MSDNKPQVQKPGGKKTPMSDAGRKPGRGLGRGLSALIGDAAVTHEGGTDYMDKGVTVTDSFEGDLAARVVVTGSVDTAQLGEYTLTYNVSDAAGNAAPAVTRKVTVVDTAFHPREGQRSIECVERRRSLLRPHSLFLRCFFF